MDLPTVVNPYRVGEAGAAYARMCARNEKLMADLETSTREDFEKLRELASGKGLCSSSPNTQSIQDLWVNRFDLFFRRLPERLPDFRPDQVPGEREIIMFMYYMIRKLAGKCGSEDLPAVTTIWTALRAIQEHCKFKYAERFAIPPGYYIRVKSHIDTLVKNGYLTRQPANEDKVWITSHIVKKMNEAILETAAREGTPSWDVTVYNALALALQSAMCSRAGDIVRSQGYKGMEAVCWKDVYLALDVLGDDSPLPDGFSSPPFTACIIMRYRKHEAHDPKRNLEVPIEELTDPSENGICLVKLLIIHALRTGAVAEKSWGQLIRNCKRRLSRKVVFTRPNDPVLPRPGGRSSYLQLDKPSEVRDIQRALSLGSRLIGLMHRVSTHNLRYGAAAEADEVAGDVTGGGTGIATVQSALGHELSSKLTKRYIGYRAPDGLWAARRAAPEVPAVKRAVKFAPQGRCPDLPRASAEEITSICEEEGLNPYEKNDRSRAQQIRKKRHFDNWVQEQQSLLDAVSPIEQDREGHPDTNGDPDTVNEGTVDDYPRILDIVDERAMDIDPRVFDAIDKEVMDINPWNTGDVDEDVMDLDGVIADSAGDSTSRADNTDDDYILEDGTCEDEPVNEKVFMIEKDLFGNSSTAMGIEDMFITMDDPQSGVVESPQTMDRDAFINHYSTVNLRRLDQSRAETSWQKGIYNGSAGVPIQDKRKFLSCPNKTSGCPMTFIKPSALARHLNGPQGCRFTSADEVPFRCKVPDCHAAFDTAEYLSTHVRMNHSVGEFKCEKEGCTSTEVFPTEAALRAHKVRVHSAKLTDVPCPVPGCSYTRLIPSKHAMQNHIKRYHPELSKEQRLRYIPVQDQFLNENPSIRFFKAQHCSFPGCTSTAVWTKFCFYVNHAKAKHGIAGREALAPFVMESPPPVGGER